MKSTFKAKVQRRWKWRILSTIIGLGVMLFFGYSAAVLIMGIPQGLQRDFWLLFGGTWIVLSFIVGQAIEHAAVRSWSTWIGDLGPTEIPIMIKELERQKEKLEKEEKSLTTD